MKETNLEQIEQLVRAGDFSTARKLLRAINLKQIDRDEVERLANIANRLDLYGIALRALKPVIHSTQSLVVPASPNEQVEYAEALRRTGLVNEAIRLLVNIEANQSPVALLRLAFCYMSQWRYREAIPHLQAYLQTIPPTEYLSFVARVNMGASLLADGQIEEAFSYLSALAEETLKAGHILLHGNCQELLAQILIRHEKFNDAEASLEIAVKSFTGGQSVYSLYLRKWRAIAKSLRDDKVHEDLIACRDQARRESDWETLRDCDLYVGVLQKKTALLDQVFFGTPYSSYRNRIMTLTKGTYSPDSSFVFNQNPQSMVTRILDPLRGAFEDDSKTNLEFGHLTHQMLLVLSKDFYRPIALGTAFSELFSSEDFEQEGGLNRVCQVVKRLRQWCKDQGDSIQIIEFSGSYQLRLAPGIGLRSFPEWPELSPSNLQWQALAMRFPTSSFTRGDAAETLNCSLASANRLLRWAATNGHANVISAGPSRRYRVAA